MISGGIEEPQISQMDTDGGTIRVWVCGCVSVWVMVFAHFGMGINRQPSRVQTLDALMISIVTAVVVSVPETSR